ncbi:MAG: hypothetical protein ACM30G_04430 [Micromonosporaceae bacterium]
MTRTAPDLDAAELRGELLRDQAAYDAVIAAARMHAAADFFSRSETYRALCAAVAALPVESEPTIC